MSKQLSRTGIGAGKIPVINTMKKDPAAANLIKFLVPEEKAGNSTNGKDAWRKYAKNSVSRDKLEKLSRITSNAIDANTNVMELLPDAKLASNIWQSVILSPNDFTRSGLQHDTTNHPNKNIELYKLLTEENKEFFTTDYKIEEKMPDMLGDMLFRTGSWVELIISQTALDNVVNGYTRGSLESIKQHAARDINYETGDFRNIGYLGNPEKTKNGLGLEHLFAEASDVMTNNDVVDASLKIKVTDNPAVLALHNFNGYLSQRRNAKAQKKHFGLEALDDVKKAYALTEDQMGDLYDTLYTKRDYIRLEDGVMTLPRDSAYDASPYAHPLVMHIPSECVIPVHVPGDPSVHVGYYILLDEDGNPLRSTKDADYYQDLIQLQQQKSESQSSYSGKEGVIEMARAMQQGGQCDFSMRDFYIKYIVELEKDMAARVANGTYGQTVSVSIETEILRVMWARTNRNLGCRLLYVPAESVTYFAFDFNRLGMGSSLLDQTKLYTSIRLALLMGTVNANMENSINVTELTVRLEEEDTDQEGTVEDILTTHFSANTSISGVIGLNSPADLINTMNAASTHVRFEGGEYLPTPTVERQNTSKNVVAPGEDIQRYMKNQQALGWYLKPQWLDPDGEVQFATELLQDAEMMVKQCVLWQKRFCILLADFMRKYALKSGALRARLLKVIEENKALWKPSVKKRKKDENAKQDGMDADDLKIATKILREFISSICVSLPAPEINKATEKRKEMLEAKKNEIGDMVDTVFTDAALRLVMPELDDQTYVDYKQSIKSKLLRDWMIKHNMADEIAPYLSSDNDIQLEEFFKSILTHDEAMAEGVLRYLEDKGELQKKFADLLAKVDPNAPPPEPAPDSTMVSDDITTEVTTEDEFSMDDDNPKKDESTTTTEDDLSTEEDEVNEEDDDGTII